MPEYYCFGINPRYYRMLDKGLDEMIYIWGGYFPCPKFSTLSEKSNIASP